MSLSNSTLREISLLPIILKSFYPQLVFPTLSEEKSAKTWADVKIVLQKSYPIKTLTSTAAHRDSSPVACPTNTFPLFLVTTYAKAPASCKPYPHQTIGFFSEWKKSTDIHTGFPNGISYTENTHKNGIFPSILFIKNISPLCFVSLSMTPNSCTRKGTTHCIPGTQGSWENTSSVRVTAGFPSPEGSLR